MEHDTQAHSMIRNLLAACTQAGDARKADDYAACFAPDGVLALGEPIEGREAIRRWMAAPSVIPQPKPQPGPEAEPQAQAPGFVSHHLTTSRIDITGPDSATGRTYWLVITAVGLDHSGYYNDRFVRHDGVWTIQHRKPRTLWIAPGSLLASGG